MCLLPPLVCVGVSVCVCFGIPFFVGCLPSVPPVEVLKHASPGVIVEGRSWPLTFFFCLSNNDFLGWVYRKNLCFEKASSLLGFFLSLYLYLHICTM